LDTAKPRSLCWSAAPGPRDEGLLNPRDNWIFIAVSAFPNWLQVIPIQVTHVKEVIRTVLRRRSDIALFTQVARPSKAFRDAVTFEIAVAGLCGSCGLASIPGNPLRK
jgi:hypothetical protein